MSDLSLDQVFSGTILIIAPHMDDEALACGGLIARLSQKERIHVICATDGMKSPSPIMPGYDLISPDLGEVRIGESKAAMTFLRVPQKNLFYLRFPESQLKQHLSDLKDALSKLIDLVNPQHIFLPFRYDRHSDHVAINHVVVEMHKQGQFQSRLVEYFVYHRWKLLPKKDIRAYIKPECLIEVDVHGVSRQKRSALDFYESQTTIFYPWQTRPILTSQLLDEESTKPEYFLFYDPSLPGPAVFSRLIPWIRIVHRVEPFLKDWKYLIGAYLKRAMRKNVYTQG
jgi:LmbE family N-acetylglucosaminyl deacetylase